MSKRILFVTAEFPPCGGGGVGRPFSIAVDLAKRGNDVCVLTASENMYWVFNKALNPEQTGIELVRVKTPNLNAWYSRLKKYLIKLAPTDHFFLWRWLALRTAFNKHEEKAFDLVISTYPFTSNHQVAYRFSKRYSVPWIADYRDPPWWMYSKLRPMQPEFYKFANVASHNVTTTDRAKCLLTEKLGLADNKITVLKNGCDSLAAEISSDQVEVSGKKGPFTILHTGSFYAEGRDVNAFIQAASEIEEEIHLRFIGDAPYETTNQLVEQLPAKTQVTFEDYKPSDEVLKIAAKSDALVVIQGELFENQIPGKIFECLALQKPLLVITNLGSATHDISKDEPNVISADYGDVESIRRGIEKILCHQVLTVDRMRYTRKTLLDNFAELVDTIE